MISMAVSWTHAMGLADGSYYAAVFAPKWNNERGMEMSLLSVLMLPCWDCCTRFYSFDVRGPANGGCYSKITSSSFNNRTCRSESLELSWWHCASHRPFCGSILMTSALARNHFPDVLCGTERSQSPATGHTSMHGRGFQLVPVLL